MQEVPEETSDVSFRRLGLDPARFAAAKGYVFDFGGVISISPKPLWETTLYPYLESLGVSRAVAKQGWTRYRNCWDGGEITFEELYRRIFADAGCTLPDGVLERLWNLDPAAWVAQLRPETLALMKALKREGHRVGILTNMAEDFHRRLFVPVCAAYRAVADVETVSGLEHLFKPERPIYDLMARRMELPPEELVFFDDTEENVLAAHRYGWLAEIYPA